jgi:hypothetical protein
LAQIKNFNNAADVVHKHCAIPREALAANKIDSEVYKVLQEGVTVSKFISSRGAKFSAFFTTLQRHGILP